MADINVARKRTRLWIWLFALGVALLAAYLVWEFHDAAHGSRDARSVRPEAAEERAARMANAPARRTENVMPPGAFIPDSPVDSVTAGAAARTVVVTPVAGSVVVYPARVAGAVRTYQDYVDGTPVPAPGPDHRYVAGGIVRLTDALRQVVQAEPTTARALEPEAIALYTVANLFVASPDSLRYHAAWMRNTADAVAGVMEKVAGSRFAGDTALARRVAGVRRAAGAIDPDQALLRQTDQVRSFFRSAEDPLRMMARVPAGG